MKRVAGQGSSTPRVTAGALTEGLEKLQDGILNKEIATEECSSFLKRTKLALRAATAVEEGIQEGTQHPLSTTHPVLGGWSSPHSGSPQS